MQTLNRDNQSPSKQLQGGKIMVLTSHLQYEHNNCVKETHGKTNLQAIKNIPWQPLSL